MHFFQGAERFLRLELLAKQTAVGYDGSFCISKVRISYRVNKWLAQGYLIELLNPLPLTALVPLLVPDAGHLAVT